MKTVILADGAFPSHPRSLAILENASFIVACDGAADKLLERKLQPNLIIGDLDSVSQTTLEKYADIVLRVKRQDNTDLMKAIEWCLEDKRTDIVILGATGGREDHTVGNLFAITSYASRMSITLHTDTGYFVALPKSGRIETFAGQQISLFPQPLNMKISSGGLKFPLKDTVLPYMHSGTLNEAEGEEVFLTFDSGILLVYRTYPDIDEK